MKKLTLSLISTLFTFGLYAQSCEEIMDFVKSKDYGTTYTSYNSTAISKVTFYSVYIDYQTHYFAIVCFKPNEYSYNCSEYIYKVGSNTKLNYSMNYYDSAGKAFWEYIEPYSDVLGCSPSFD
ncbi:MAG: hypothetical protein RQ875_14305 [Vicingaceae bacterium]|nr:hypothetical protein [Vicingaceae bacterium]